MPDGSAFPGSTKPPASVTALVGNPTGLIFQLREIEARLTEMDHRAGTGGRHSYEGRSLQRQAMALVNLAVELAPTSMADCVAIMSAAYEKINDAYREEREAKDVSDLLEAPMNALSRVVSFMAPEIGLTIESFASNYTCIGELA